MTFLSIFSPRGSTGGNTGSSGGGGNKGRKARSGGGGNKASKGGGGKARSGGVGNAGAFPKGGKGMGAEQLRVPRGTSPGLIQRAIRAIRAGVGRVVG